MCGVYLCLHNEPTHQSNPRQMVGKHRKQSAIEGFKLNYWGDALPAKLPRQQSRLGTNLNPGIGNEDACMCTLYMYIPVPDKQADPNSVHNHRYNIRYIRIRS